MIGSTIGHFPNKSGFAIGLVKSCLGLSAAVFTNFYVTFLAPNALSFLLMIAILPAICGLLMSQVIKSPFTDSDGGDGGVSKLARGATSSQGQTHEAGEQDMYLFSVGSILVAVLSVFLLASSMVEPKYLEFVGMLSISVLFVLIPFSSHSQEQITRKRAERYGGQEGIGSDIADDGHGNGLNDQNPHYVLTQPLLLDDEANIGPSVAPTAAAYSGLSHENDGTKLGDDMSFTQAIRQPAFWIFFVYCIIGFGTGMGIINNIAQIAHSKAKAIPSLTGVSEGASVTLLVSLIRYAPASLSGRSHRKMNGRGHCTFDDRCGPHWHTARLLEHE